MKLPITIILFLTLFSLQAQEINKTQYDIAYQRGKDIIVSSFRTNNNLILKNLRDPALSQDGYMLACTKFKPSSSISRAIVVIDLNTKKEFELNVKNDNYFGAVWSPESNYIAFHIMVDHSWQIGIYNINNSSLRILKGNSRIGLHQPIWTSDKKFLIAHDLKTIFKFDNDFNLVDTININETIGENYWVGSGNKFLFTSDNKYIIFSCGIDEEHADAVGPNEAVFAYDVMTKHIQRLSPSGMFCGNICIDYNDNIFFHGTKEHEKSSNIYKYNLTKNKLELVINNGRSPSVRKNKNAT